VHFISSKISLVIVQTHTADQLHEISANLPASQHKVTYFYKIASLLFNYILFYFICQVFYGFLSGQQYLLFKWSILSAKPPTKFAGFSRLQTE